MPVVELRLGQDDAELKKVVLRLPQVFSLSVEANVLPSLAALQSRLGLDDAELKKVVLGQPAVLSYSVEVNLLPKLAFLQRELGLSDETLSEHILRMPAILGYSLEGRYKPRVELCRELGLPAESMVLSYITKKPDDFEALCRRAASG